MKKKYILVGCENGGVEFSSLIGKENVAYFCDNKYQGKFVNGVEIISLQDLRKIHSAYDVVISDRKYAGVLAEELNKLKIPFQLAFGSSKFFPFWQSIHWLSILGMNMSDMAGNAFSSGEIPTLQLLKQRIVGGGGMI